MPRYKPFLCTALFVSVACLQAEDITWQLHYDAKSLPGGVWQATGTPKTTLEAEGLRLTDDDKAFANFRAAFKPQADSEIIVEVVAKVFSMRKSYRASRR